MPSNAFSYLEDDPEQDDAYSEIAEEFASQQKEEAEEIFHANQHGNGFAPEKSSSGPYMPQKLNARHREIIRLHCLGYKHVEIGNMLGCTAQLCSMIVNSPLGVDLIQEIQKARTGSVKDVHERLQEMSPFAAEIMLDIMASSKKESNRLRAAEKVLEMTGHKAASRHEHMHAHLTKEEIEELKQNARGELPENMEVSEDD